MFCAKCQEFWENAISKATLKDEVKSSNDIEWAPHTTTLHSSMHDLEKSSRNDACTICRLILALPTIHEKEGLLANNSKPIAIILELDATKPQVPVLQVTFAEAEPKSDGSPNWILPKRTIASCAGLLTDDEFAATLKHTMTLDNSSTGSDAALALASFWLKRCLSTHDKCNAKNDRSGWIPTRVVDVGDSDDSIRLIETGTDIPEDGDRSFVALSHCWGKIHIIRTLKENYADHRIIQDNTEDWRAEAATMCDVYRHAVFTIAAAHAPGGDVGCFEDRDGVLQFPFVIEIPAKQDMESDSPRPTRIQYSSYGRVQAPLGREPPLYGRAWVLQEQLLSPRMLIFDGSQIRWECLCTHGSERSPLGGMSRHIGHQKTIRNGVMDNVDFFQPQGPDTPPFTTRAQSQSWYFSVMDYTHRGMTKSSDRVVALHGIAQAVARTTKNEYVAGLWKDELWTGLLWSIPHYKEYTSTTSDAFDLAANRTVRHDNPIAPTWSWASVTVPVVYPVPTIIFIDPIVKILNVSVSGTPDKLTGSVEIRGHIRTGHINPIYPYAIREAATTNPDMSFYDTTTGEDELFTFNNNHSFSPADYFIFSPTPPAPGKSKTLQDSPDWRLTRGTFRPDELLDPGTEITFLALAQRYTGSEKGSLLETHEKGDPFTVWSIALVPTGRVEGEYRRIGYAEWVDCSWYGYMCGHKSRPGRDIESVEKGGWRGLLKREPLYGEKPGKGHRHEFVPGEVPYVGGYHRSVGVGVREGVVTIV
ncbi:hypothetical protein M011DRAFT_455747 [Sporormia fimetaria CBS 119925]|uniref:Heterokaryon incompatibility domain-containing protein n=1 Tax=Sporormia fimetaria CBS 119925 TaxID=1340428 RepID=A0A6A6VNF3_9PLEO|nr:hypothetical protein M011DRAFT_455747 [Sporormia fimetaria CBS 119925]